MGGPGGLFELRSRISRRTALLLALFVGAWAAEVSAVWGYPETFVNYGDVETIPTLIRDGRTMTRWLVPSSALDAAYALASRVEHTSPVGFVMQASRAWSLASGLLVLLAFPSWAAFMALTCPMLLRFGTGYSEVYPFIAPILVAAALCHVGGSFDRLRPWMTGVLCAALLLLYVGFLPLAVLIAAYAIARNPWGVFELAGAALVSVAVVSAALFGPAFAPTLLSDLNTGDVPFLPGEKGWAMPGTPFYYPGKAIRSLPGFFAAVVTGVGIGPLFTGVVISFRERRLLLLVSTYLIVSVFTVPRLGPIADTDLFFQLYALAGLSIGRALDGLGKPSAVGTAPDAGGATS